MKTIKNSIVTILFVSFLATFTSCASSSSMQKESEQVMAYTLKNKKELMKQKIADNKRKTVIALP